MLGLELPFAPNRWHGDHRLAGAEGRLAGELGVRRDVIQVTGDTRYDQVWARALSADRDSEIRRAVDKGHRGVVMPSVPMMLRELPHVNEPHYDPIWATCQELDVPLCFHAGASRKLRALVNRKLQR